MANGSWSIAIHWDAHMIWGVQPSIFRRALLLCPLTSLAWLELLHRKEPSTIFFIVKVSFDLLMCSLFASKGFTLSLQITQKKYRKKLASTKNQ